MKITIITFQGSHNYGAVLQAHALQQALIDLGHEPTFLNYLPPHLERANRKVVPVRNVKFLLVNLAALPFRRMLARRYRRFESFRENFLKTTRRYLSLGEVEERPPKTDLFVVGSDQVWNMEEGGNPLFFLRFLKAGTPRPSVLAYAPSFGTAAIPKEYEERFVDWAKIYDFVSVRESSGKKLAERLLGKPVSQVLDPIFLIEAAYWRKLAPDRLMEGPYLAFYSLEATGVVSDCLLALARHLQLPVVVLGKPGAFMLKCRAKVAIDAGPLEFLSWIVHADFVVTNSFHATAFSALLQVPFATVAHSTRNARMESLFETIAQPERLLRNPSDLDDERFQGLAKQPPKLESDQGGTFPLALQTSKGFLKDSLRVAADPVEGGRA